MSQSTPERIQLLLSQLTSLNTARRLFAELNYDISRDPISTHNWPDPVRQPLLADPEIIAAHDRFQIIFAQLNDERLSLSDERAVITKLLQQHPYALFLFANNDQSKWHIVNVKYDADVDKRRLFRRLYIGDHERRFGRLRTASERLALLDLETVSRDLFGISPLAIQQRHDEAFDVEAVTKSFFKDYRAIFEQAEAQITGLEGDHLRLFTQKLFNRLMFIIFLERKGWLHFNGRYDYLQALWQAHRQEKQSEPNANFYADRLHLLFFSGLNYQGEVNAIDINQRGFLQTRIGQVPYLNGGLFEEDDLDRVTVHVPDKITQQALETLFYRYNFTVTEATPLDVEVAVDPEMLGKIFEELITGRHESGSYYTPKPIVSFMGREALKGYLGTACPQESTTALADFVDDHNPAALRNPEAILTALKEITICDPACGSGAYLVGMLHELLDLRQALFATRGLDAVTVYRRKLEIIQHNLYGVDIDPFAVNIARLRLWLSLVVDFEGETPEPLPNLDFKIEAGDSLTAPDPSGGLQPNLFRQQQIRTYFRLKGEYMQAHGGEKRALKRQIDDLRAEIKTWAHPKQVTDSQSFDWVVEFAEIFMGVASGFDIVVANPPYVNQRLISGDFKYSLKTIYPKVYTGATDLYVYFYARALQLLKTGGMLAFITSNRFMRAGYGEKLRRLLSGAVTIQTIVDFGDLPVFAASAYPVIVVIKAQSAPLSHLAQALNIDDISYIPQIIEIVHRQAWQQPQASLRLEGWSLVKPAVTTLLQKIRENGRPLAEIEGVNLYRGVTTGFNQAFVINQSTRDSIVSDDPATVRVIKPWLRGRDIKMWKIAWNQEYIIVIQNSDDVDASNPWKNSNSEIEALRIFRQTYPSIYSHFEQYEDALRQRSDQGKYWWELRPCTYYKEFEKPKVIWAKYGIRPAYTFDRSGYYCGNTVFALPTDNYVLTGILNSSVIQWYATHTFNLVRGGYIEWITTNVGQLPIPTVGPNHHYVMEELVENLMGSENGEQKQIWEQELNQLVYQLYNLSTSEITLIEEAITASSQSQATKTAMQTINKLESLKED